MQVYSQIYQYIENNGGPEAFDPAQEPDSFLELEQQILELVSGGNPAIMATYPDGELEEMARYYLDLPSTSDVKVV